MRPATQAWSVISYTSTLYTRPILDVLTDGVPCVWKAEVRLGLQEALINAAKHGNSLDPAKTITIQYANHAPIYQWLISDQGCGFAHQQQLQRCTCGNICETDESGRGTFILTQIFDYVEWNGSGTQLYLGKYIRQHCDREPLIC